MADYFSPNSNPYPYGYQKQFPTRVISGSDILELNGDQQQNLIGHTLAYCNELEASLNEAITKAEGYYTQLVDAGLIVPPKSSEDIMREQAEQQKQINETLLSTIQALSDKLQRLEDNHNAEPAADSTSSDESVQPGSNKKSGARAPKL